MGIKQTIAKSNAIEEYYNEFGENSYIAKDNQTIYMYSIDQIHYLYIRT